MLMANIYEGNTRVPERIKMGEERSNRWLLGKQVGPSQFLTCAQKLFLLDAHHIYTQTTVVQMSAIEEEEMLVNIGAGHANVRWLQLRVGAEGSLNVFRSSPFDPSDSIYTRSVCVVFFGGACYRDVLSFR
jgi:hypothetical protein